MMDNPGETDRRRAGDEPSAEPAPAHRALASGELATAWELDEFFQALGPVLRLPPKEAEPKPVKEKQAAIAKSVRRRRLLIRAAATVLTIAVFQAPLLRLLTPDLPVPDEFLGAWRTSSPQYADRGFALTGDTLRLQLGPGRTASYPITGVRRLGTADSASFMIAYLDDSSPLEMGLRMDEDVGVRLVNLPGIVWHKEGR